MSQPLPKPTAEFGITSPPQKNILNTLLDSFLVDTSFYRKVFSKQAIQIWILIPIISRDIFKLHPKKIYTKYDKIIIVKKNLELNDLGFLCYSAKAYLDLYGFI